MTKTEEKITKIEKLILESKKAGRKEEAEVYKLIKAKYQEFKTAENAKDMEDEDEEKLLSKMVKERVSTAETYKSIGSEKALDNAKQELYEADIIRKLLPKEASEDEIRTAVEEFIKTTGKTLAKNDMGNCMKYIKNKLPNANGKLASSIVMTYIN